MHMRDRGGGVVLCPNTLSAGPWDENSPYFDQKAARYPYQCRHHITTRTDLSGGVVCEDGASVGALLFSLLWWIVSKQTLYNSKSDSNKLRLSLSVRQSLTTRE